MKLQNVINYQLANYWNEFSYTQYMCDYNHFALDKDMDMVVSQYNDLTTDIC